MSSYKNNKDGTLTFIGQNINVNQEPQEQNITITALKALIASSSDFDDFKAKISIL